jgi:hypothetical protein
MVALTLRPPHDVDGVNFFPHFYDIKQIMFVEERRIGGLQDLAMVWIFSDLVSSIRSDLIPM